MVVGSIFNLGVFEVSEFEFFDPFEVLLDLGVNNPELGVKFGVRGLEADTGVPLNKDFRFEELNFLDEIPLDLTCTWGVRYEVIPWVGVGLRKGGREGSFRSRPCISSFDRGMVM